MKLLKFWCRWWAAAGIPVSILTIILVVIFWDKMSVLAIINAFNFIALLLHQVEEYVWPGGGAYMANRIQQGNNIGPFHFDPNAPIDRYPLNQLSAMIGNCLVVYIVYTLPIFFPNVIWLGICPVLFGMVFQFVVHVIAGNLKMKSYYNPGMIAVLLGHVPLGILYFHYASQQGLLTSGNVWGGIGYLLVVMLIFSNLTYRIFPNPNSKWPFSEKEMETGRKIEAKFFNKR